MNWYANEAGIELTMKAPRPSNHPFGQVPFLTDDGGVEVFESGAILLYLADAYGKAANAKERAGYTKWVVWANSELDGLCFGKGMSGTSMDKPDLRPVSVLESILGKSEWLVGGEFSVADVAVASYLNYVPIFFGRASLAGTPNIVKYMQRSAERPAFAKCALLLWSKPELRSREPSTRFAGSEDACHRSLHVSLHAAQGPHRLLSCARESRFAAGPLATAMRTWSSRKRRRG